MRIELKNFFKYYNGELSHHRASVDKLAKEIAKVAPELLEDDSEWVAIFRNEVVSKDKDQEIVLPVLYYPQTDNYTQPERTCNSSACAMALEYFKPGTLHGPKGDDEYIREVFQVGDTTDHSVQTKILNDFNVSSEFRYDLDFDDLDRELQARRPIVIGILHRGPLYAPTGGHMIVVIGRTEKGDYIVHDPYGDLYDGYTSTVYNGSSAIYERKVLEKRWTADGRSSGWGRVFFPQ